MKLAAAVAANCRRRRAGVGIANDHELDADNGKLFQAPAGPGVAAKRI